MSYYDDWVDPNGFFRGGARLGGGRSLGERDKTPTPCPHCNKILKGPWGVAQHVKAKHPNVEPADAQAGGQERQ